MRNFVEKLNMNRAEVPVSLALSWVTPKLLDEAANAANMLAGSYRGFNVGNGSLAVDGTGNYWAVIGANYKSGPTKKGVCAEFLTLHRARTISQGLRLLSFHVDAPNQPDAASGLITPTLHPCWNCRRHVLEDKNVDSDSAIVTRLRGTYQHQVLLPADLITLHVHGITTLQHQVIEDEGYTGLRAAQERLNIMLQQSEDVSTLPPAWDFRNAWNAGLQNDIGALH